MTEGSPWRGYLTTPAHHEKRFGLEWVLPLEPGLPTAVALYDLHCAPPHPVAVGHGADEADSLLDLWGTVTDQGESADAIRLIAEAYERRTGRPPDREG